MKSLLIPCGRIVTILALVALCAQCGCQTKNQLPSMNNWPAMNNWFGATSTHQLTSHPLPPTKWQEESAGEVKLASGNPSEVDMTEADQLTTAPIPSMQTEVPDY